MPIIHHKDFLKYGDPDLTYPHGKTYTPICPKGKPNYPGPEDPQAERDRMVREWLELLT